MAVVSAAIERKWDAVEVRKERRSSDMEREVTGGLHDVVWGGVKAWVPVKMASSAMERKDFIMSGLVVCVVVVVVFLLLAPPSHLPWKDHTPEIFYGWHRLGYDMRLIVRRLRCCTTYLHYTDNCANPDC